MKVIQDIRDRFVPVPEPKESKLDKALKIILFIITVAGIAALAYMAYKKFNEYMRNLCEANCEDYLDECCSFEFDDDDEAIFLTKIAATATLKLKSPTKQISTSGSRRQAGITRAYPKPTGKQPRKQPTPFFVFTGELHKRSFPVFH